MFRRNFNHIRAGEVRCFFVSVQVCAVISAALTTRALPDFLPNLAGLTLLLQGAAVLSAGGWWFLSCAASRAEAGQSWARLLGRLPARPLVQPLVQPLARLLPRSLSQSLRVAGGAPPLALAGFAGFSASAGVLVAFGRYLPGVAGGLPVASQVLGAAAALAFCLYTASLRGRNRRLQRSEVKTLAHLSSQRLRHHFLFNTLNTTVSLIGNHPDVAMRTLEELAELFRAMLKQKPTTTLAEEIEFVRRYICIERIRLGARLGVEWRVPAPDCLRARVPTMLIQPLVENAVYHGIETQDQGGIIRIGIESRDDRVFFEIRNPIGDAVPMSRSEGNHTAQKSVQERLTRAYGDACHFTFQQGEEEYRVMFSIPKETIQ